MQKRTRAWWQGEVRRWAESGQSADAFASGKAYSPRTLTWWRTQLKAEVSKRRDSDGLRLVPAHIVVRTAATAIWAEVGGARVEIRPGFDAKLLRDVVAALRGVQ
jgi:hypothetical protein